MAGKVFVVGDSITMKVVITPTLKTSSNRFMNTLKATSYTSSETVFTASAQNINSDGSLTAQVSCPITNACGANDALAAVIASGQYT